MKHKKAGFDIQVYLITFLLFSAVVVTLGTMATSMRNDYQTITPVTVDTTFENTYNKLDTVTSITQQEEDKMQGTDVGSESSQSTFYGNAIASVKIVFQSFSSLRSLVQDMAVVLHVPAIWVTVVISAMMIMILTSIVFMIFQSRGN